MLSVNELPMGKTSAMPAATAGLSSVNVASRSRYCRPGRSGWR